MEPKPAEVIVFQLDHPGVAARGGPGGYRRSPRTLSAVSLVSATVALALVAPSALAATTAVNEIPGGGWTQSSDNTAGGTAAIGTGPAGGLGTGGLGTGSLHLTTAASDDVAGISRPLAGSLADLTGGSWMLFVTGSTGNPSSEAASLRFAVLRTGTTELSTVSIELSNNGGYSPDAWGVTTFDDTSIVWQTNTTGAFCLIASPCTLAAFKAQYPAANLTELTVAIGPGVPAVATFVDDVSVTIDGTTEAWDFEPAATAPTPTPRPEMTAGPTLPPTSTLEPAESAPGSSLPAVVGTVVGLAGLLGWATAWPMRDRRTDPEDQSSPPP